MGLSSKLFEAPFPTFVGVQGLPKGMEGGGNWTVRGRRTAGNLKPRKVDEGKLAFLREAYEPDEEHLVAEALFDLANMFEDEEDEDKEEASQPQHSPSLNGKRTRKGTVPGAPTFAAQQPLKRSYSQQRASPLPHNMQGGAAAAAANNLQQSLMAAQQQLQQQQQQQQPPPPPQQTQHLQHPQQQLAAAGQAAHGSTHPQVHASAFPPHPYYTNAGLPGSGPFFMPPYSQLSMQLPPGALSGKLATTLLPNGSPEPLAFGPNGALMPLPGAWPHGLLHPQQRQQHQATLAQQLQPHLGLVGGLPFAGATVTTGLNPPGVGTAQASAGPHGGKVEVAAPAGSAQRLGMQNSHGEQQQLQQPLGRAQVGSAFTGQEGRAQIKAENGVGGGVGAAAGVQASLKRCALHVRIAHMIVDRQRQQAGGALQQRQQEQQAPHAPQPHHPSSSAQPEPQQEGMNHHRSSSPPSTEPNGLVRQHSAGSTSTCPSAPSTLTDSNTSPASTRAPHAPPGGPQARAQQPSSPGREAANASQQQQQQQVQAGKGAPAAEPQPAAAAVHGPTQILGPAASTAPASAAGLLQGGPFSSVPLQVQQQYVLQQLMQQQRQQQQQQLQQLVSSQAQLASSNPLLGSLMQGLPGMGISQPPLPTGHLPPLSAGLPGTSAAHMNSSLPPFPAAMLGLPVQPSQHPQQQQHLHSLHQNGAYGAGGAAGMPQAGGLTMGPHLLAQMIGMPGLLSPMSMGYPSNQHPQQYHAPGQPAFSLSMVSSPATQQQQQQQQPVQAQQAQGLGITGANGGGLPLGKPAVQGPQVH